MRGNDIRKKYLDFFVSKGHLALPSASLVPDNDPSLLLIGAGMAPFKAFFTGKMTPPSTRVTTSQKCIRTGDLENVGRTARHHTLFEMLGNFSFGDYFKTDAIHWAWEFLTDEKQLNISPSKLWITIHPEDEEAFSIWNKEVGVPAERIIRLEENFWEIGSGPCGPCSEIFIDLGEERGCGSPDCTAGCECDRYLEIWNLVFTQYDNDGEGNYTPLAKKNIDTGAGLERLASALQNKQSNFETDLLFPIIKTVCRIGNINYNTDPQKDISLKVLADHARAMVFLVGDGVLPSTEGRGYVLRRIIRRAIRHARLLGIETAILNDLSNTVIEIMGDHYSELTEKKDFIQQVLNLEERRFQETLASGSELLVQEMIKLKAEGETVLKGKTAFKLYDTYGFPWELTAEILEDDGFSLDQAGFQEAMKEQQERARAAQHNSEAVFEIPDLRDNLKVKAIYDEDTKESPIALIFKSGEILNEVTAGEEVAIILESTPFYGESGGQVGDIGFLSNQFGKIKIQNTKKMPDGTIYHIGTITEGTLRAGQTVDTTINLKNRQRIARNHTATHLLHAALRDILGTHINQSGSYVGADRLRFDFTHFSSITSEELVKIEQQVNLAIAEHLLVTAKTMHIDEAKSEGATALFGEKYDDEVRVLTVGDISKELCGGTHVRNTAELLSFKIISESGIGSGVRRIEAISGDAVYQWMSSRQLILSQLSDILNIKVEDLPYRIEKIVSDYKNLEQKLKRLEEIQMVEKAKGIMMKYNDNKMGDFTVIATQIEAESIEELRHFGDVIKANNPSFVALLSAIIAPDKVALLGLASKNAVANGVHVGKLIKILAQEIGGNGGGKADMAQAGGKDPSKLQNGTEKALEELKNQLGVNEEK